jgi:osmoprotectant transport system ATP-binding protein
MIDVVELTKVYGESTVVDGVSFGVAEGELLALVGGSGSGKTTTLKMINRLVEPTRGRVVIDGDDVSRVAAHALRRRIGYVFQRIGLFPHLTIEENVGVTLELLGWDPERRARRVLELLELVELEAGMGRRYPGELSGGQAQRVAVARALAAEPALMLLDEPFSALDPLTRDRLQASFAALRAKLRLTAVLVTHDMSEALTLGDRIAVMQAGRLIQIGKPRELLDSPASEYVERLLDAPRRQARALERALAEDPA